MSDMRLLVIEDDAEAAAYLSKAFREQGHTVDVAADGVDGYDRAREGQYDVLIVDRMLPKLDGLSLINALRNQKVETPILILSALGAGRRPREGVCGRAATTISPSPTPSPNCWRAWKCWRAGAAAAGGEETVYRVGGLELDRLAHKLTRDGREITLAAARVPAAGISDAPRRPGRHAHDVARERLGLSFRPADERHRRAYLAPARQDRQGPRVPCSTRSAGPDT